MHKLLWPLAMLSVVVFLPALGNAQGLGGGCDATHENAKYQLQKAGGDGDLALKDWLHYCSPDADTIVKFSREIQRAEGSIPNVKSAPAATVTPAAPKPNSKSEPYGTFAQSGRANYDDRSGYSDWDSTLVIRKDGTAELKVKLKHNLNPGWVLTGCVSGSRFGTVVISQKYSVTVSGNRVSLDPQGQVEVARAEPSCWEYSMDYYKSIFTTAWSFDFINGRLKNDDGEYFRQD